jgi:hypothetical protein
MVNSIKKGKRGEWELGVRLKELGFGKARRGQQHTGLEGEDVVGIDGIHIECKRVESININKAMKQSITDAQHGDIPVVMHRRSRDGWLVTMRLEDWVEMKKGI